MKKIKQNFVLTLKYFKNFKKLFENNKNWNYNAIKLKKLVTS